MRLLFASIHRCVDPSTGAALCTSKLLEPLAAWGADCRALTTWILDPEREVSLDKVLATMDLSAGLSPMTLPREEKRYRFPPPAQRKDTRQQASGWNDAR